MRFDRENAHTYPAAQRMIQQEDAERLGYVGDTMIDCDAQPVVSAAHDQKLTAYARRLRMVGIAHGSMPLGPYRFEIDVTDTGYIVVAQTGGGLDYLRG